MQDRFNEKEQLLQKQSEEKMIEVQGELEGKKKELAEQSETLEKLKRQTT